MNKLKTIILVLVIYACNPMPKEDDHLILNLMTQNSGQFELLLKNPEFYEAQIIYTQINRDENNQPHFKSFYFNVDTNRYFYPASTVKLPAVLLSLEKLRQLNVRGLNKFTPMFSDSVYAGQLSVKADSTSEDGLPSIAHYAKKILVVSDNDAFNRLYEFLGQKEFNKKLHEKGYHARILHRLERFLSPDQNRHTEAVRFVKNDSTIFFQPMLVNNDSILPPGKILKGTAYMVDDSIVYEPFDFTYKNFFHLTDQQEILKAIIFPNAVAAEKRFMIDEEDRRFVLQYMSQLPGETTFPPYYKDTTYYDASCKFLLFGEDKSNIPSHIRIFNKIGNAYGFMIDNAYVVDFDHNVEFMLSTVIDCNTNNIYNDGVYDYETIGYPFMKNLGQMIYQYELKRDRTRSPDLSEFKLKYDRPTE